MEESKPVTNFVSYLSPFLQPQSIQERLPPSDVVGNIRFSHPTLYVFPGGQGDSALFGINGFNMLIDGGFSRKACFWDFTRHLDRLDAILITRMSDENTQGINAVLERKTVAPVYPQIGHLFANILEPKKDKEREKNDDDDRDKLLVNVIHEGNTMIENLRILNLKPQICFRDNVCDPINLYHKVGHGKLDMYVLNPSKDSREVREFLSRWHEDSGHLGKFRSGINVDGKEVWLPIANLVSICALLIWSPANPNDTITRLLFPGSTPQHKIFKGIEKLKKLECLKQPVCSPSSVQAAKGNMKSEKRKKSAKIDNRNVPPDNTNVLADKKEKLAKRRIEKLRKEKDEKEKRDKDKEEQEKADKEKKEKERLEKIEKKKKAEKEKKDKERQEKKEREAAIAAAKKEREEKEATAKKEREEKEAVAKKEKEEKEAAARREREALRKEKDEKEAAKKKEREAKAQKELENKREMIEQKNNENVIKKKTSSAKSVKKSQDTATAISTRKIMPSKPTTAKLTTPPPTKLKKDENNKKVMETRKAAVAARSLGGRTERPDRPDNDQKMKVKKVAGRKTVARLKTEHGKVDSGSVADKVSEAIANGEIDNSRVIKDDEVEKEIVVEKDQIEDMENIPVEDMEPVRGNDDDEEEAELQMIKDEEEEENQQPVPDIAEKMADVFNEQKAREEEKLPPLQLEKEKIAYTHVKTPDEVDDLPEHEVAAHEVDEEVKIAMDENEKETKALPDDKSDASVEAVRDIDTIEVPVEQKQKETGAPFSPEQEICIEKEELESNEKFSKEMSTTNQNIEESAQLEIETETEDKALKASEPEDIQKENLVTKLSEGRTQNESEDIPIDIAEDKTKESKAEAPEETSKVNDKIENLEAGEERDSHITTSKSEEKIPEKSSTKSDTEKTLQENNETCQEENAEDHSFTKEVEDYAKFTAEEVPVVETSMSKPVPEQELNKAANGNIVHKIENASQNLTDTQLTEMTQFTDDDKKTTPETEPAKDLDIKESNLKEITTTGSEMNVKPEIDAKEDVAEVVSVDDKSDASVEAVRDNETIEVLVEQKEADRAPEKISGVETKEKDEKDTPEEGLAHNAPQMVPEVSTMEKQETVMVLEKVPAVATETEKEKDTKPLLETKEQTDLTSQTVPEVATKENEEKDTPEEELVVTTNENYEAPVSETVPPVVSMDSEAKGEITGSIIKTGSIVSTETAETSETVPEVATETEAKKEDEVDMAQESIPAALTETAKDEVGKAVPTVAKETEINKETTEAVPVSKESEATKTAANDNVEADQAPKTVPVVATKTEVKDETKQASSTVPELATEDNQLEENDFQEVTLDNVETKNTIEDRQVTISDDDSEGVEVIPETDQIKEEVSKNEFHPGVLEITVHRANDLVNNDTFSKSDPYVKLRYKKEEFRSKTIANNLNPEWNFSSSFDILNEDEKYIHINVYDDDFGTDNIQGCYSLPLEVALNQLTQEGRWFSLIGCESGRIFVSSKFTKIKMEDKSTEKPVEVMEDSSTSTLQKAEKLVSDIVERAEKVVTEVEAHLEKENNLVVETAENKHEPFSEISKGSQEVIEKIVEKIDKNLEEKATDEETNKTSINTTEISETSDTFKEIEKESQDVVEKIELSMNQAKDTKMIIRSGFVKLIVFEASNLPNTKRIQKSDPYVKINFEDKEYKSRIAKNTSSPEWNFTANLMISSNVDSDITLVILDAEEQLGSYTLSVSEAIRDTDKEADWHQLDNGQGGKILFSVIYIPDDDEEVVKSSDAASEREQADKISYDEKAKGEFDLKSDSFDVSVKQTSKPEEEKRTIIEKTVDIKNNEENETEIIIIQESENVSEVSPTTADKKAVEREVNSVEAPADLAVSIETETKDEDGEEAHLVVKETEVKEEKSQATEKVCVMTTDTEEKDEAYKTSSVVATVTEEKDEIDMTVPVVATGAENKDESDKSVHVVATATEEKVEANKTVLVVATETEEKDEADKTVTEIVKNLNEKSEVESPMEEHTISTSASNVEEDIKQVRDNKMITFHLLFNEK